MKERILAAAVQEINQYGVKFTIDGVVARLGISKKTLYQYFSSKEVLVASITDAALADVKSQKQEIINSDMDLVCKLTALVVVEPRMFENSSDWIRADIKKYYPREWEKIKAFQRQSAEVMIHLLEDGIQNGHIRQINTRIAVQMLQSMCSEFLQYRFLHENHLTFKEALQNLVDIFLYGVLTNTAESNR